MVCARNVALIAQPAPTPQECEICGEFVTQCRQCKSTYYLLNTTCEATCPDTYYNNVHNRTCSPCDDPCKKCTTSATYCQSCGAGKYLYNHECRGQCPDGTYEYDENGENSQCVTCRWPCATCSDQNTCLSCTSPYGLNSSQCITDCGIGLFINTLNQCQPCSVKCLTCNLTGCL